MLLLLCCSLLAGGVMGQGHPPPSPCPDVFQYTFDKGQWSGHIVVAIPDQAKRLVVVASLFVIDVVLPPEHPGDLHLTHDPHAVKKKILERQTNTVEYGLVFPTQSPLPRVDKIKVNRNVICQGPPVEAKIRKKVSFTHRLNGLRAPPSKSHQHNDPKQGRILNKADKHREFNGGKDSVGNKEKNSPKNAIELLDNEVYQEEVPKEKYVPNYKNQGRNFNTGFQDKDLKQLFQNEFDSNEDAEVLDSEILQESSLDVEDSPGHKSKGPGFNTGFHGVKNPKDLPETEFDPNEDTEMLDNEIPQEDTLEVEHNPDHKSKGPGFNTGFHLVKNPKDLPETEFDPNEDTEMLDNEIPQEDSLVVDHNPFHKSKEPGFNTGFYDDTDDEDLP